MAGLPGWYTGHSPRVGMLHDLAIDNAEMPSLMQAGGWSTGQSVIGVPRDDHGVQIGGCRLVQADGKAG